MLKWIPAADGRFSVNGLPWLDENGGRLARFPDRAQESVPGTVWSLSSMTSGGRIRFASDSGSFSIRASHGSEPRMIDMSPLGHSGLDLYAGPPGEMNYWGTSTPQFGGETYEHTYFRGLRSEMREFTLYLPTYNDLDMLEIGLDEEALIAVPAPYALDKPVVFYGSSITQGGCASRPGNGYVPVLSREMNVDVVNLGFNGSGKGEPSVCSLLAEIDAACYVLDFHVNLPTAAELEAVYAPFYRQLRSRRPETPILMVSPLYSSSEWYDKQTQAKYGGMRSIIRSVYEEAVAQGDRHVYTVDGCSLIGPGDEGGYVDGLHPNDIGFRQMAERLQPILREVLQIP